MGRGSSKAQNKAGGGVGLSSIPNGRGGTIELDSPLTYGEKDAALTGKERATIEAWEDKRRKNKIEYALLLDENGDVVAENKGGRGSVRSTLYQLNQTKTFTHNHPREQESLLGGTFSDSDLINFANNTKNTTKRATAKEGTYSITKTSGFDSTGFRSFVKESTGANLKEYKDAVKQTASNYKNKSISLDDYYKANDKAFNNMLLKCHNDLLNNQKKYGYNYTLEAL